MGTANNDLTNVTLSIQNHLTVMNNYFKEGVELTFIARTPGNDAADFLITTDDLEEVSGLIERSKERRPNYSDKPEALH